MRIPTYINIDKLRGILVSKDGFLFFNPALFHDRRWVRACTDTPRYRKVSIPGAGTSMLAHRVIWALHSGEWPTKFIDHINGDPKDNRIKNLRLATATENARNRRASKNSASRFVGVSWCSERRKWKATIEINGRTVYLGRFQREQDAAQAYRERAEKEYGEFLRK